MIYHICYESLDREKSLRALEANSNRVVLLSAPRPAVLFGGRKVSFYVVAGFGVIEILEPAEVSPREGTRPGPSTRRKQSV